MRGALLILALGAVAACDRGPGTSSSAATGSNGAPGSAAPRARVAGVYPDRWKCDSLVTPDALAGVLGGPVRVTDAASIPPNGVPHPCNYLVDVSPPEAWTFDIDCRDHMKERADALFAQYSRDSADQVAQYAQLADAGALKRFAPPPTVDPNTGEVQHPPADAGPPARGPEGAAEVAVGAKGLDHHGQALIFIDDDAPCYVRVVGPDANKRLDLARLIAKQLTFENAPMTPRPLK